MRFASSLATSRLCSALSTSAEASFHGLPASRTMVRTNSSLRAATPSPTRVRMPALSSDESRRVVSNASTAARTAFSTCSGVGA